jgi:hypothetical protein
MTSMADWQTWQRGRGGKKWRGWSTGEWKCGTCHHGGVVLQVLEQGPEDDAIRKAPGWSRYTVEEGIEDMTEKSETAVVMGGM